MKALELDYGQTLFVQQEEKDKEKKLATQQLQEANKQEQLKIQNEKAKKEKIENFIQNREEAISQKLVTNDEYDWLSEESIKIYEKMARIADNAGFILADLKLEFGKLNNEIILADSIGPDEFRLWPKDAFKIGETQEAYDKQLLRDWLTENGYQKKFDDARSSGDEPIAPSIPSDLVSKMTQRYVTAYERLTGNTL